MQNIKKTITNRKVKSLEKLRKGYPVFNGHVVRNKKNC